MEFLEKGLLGVVISDTLYKMLFLIFNKNKLTFLYYKTLLIIRFF